MRIIIHLSYVSFSEDFVKVCMYINHLEQCLACTKCSVKIRVFFCLFHDRCQFKGQRGTKNRKKSICLSLFSLFLCFFQRPQLGLSGQRPRHRHGKRMTHCLFLTQEVRGCALMSGFVFGHGNNLCLPACLGIQLFWPYILPQARMKVKHANSIRPGFFPLRTHFWAPLPQPLLTWS